MTVDYNHSSDLTIEQKLESLKQSVNRELDAVRDESIQKSGNYMRFTSSGGLDIGYESNGVRVNIRGDGIRFIDKYKAIFAASIGSTTVDIEEESEPETEAVGDGENNTATFSHSTRYGIDYVTNVAFDLLVYPEGVMGDQYETQAIPITDEATAYDVIANENVQGTIMWQRSEDTITVTINATGQAIHIILRRVVISYKSGSDVVSKISMGAFPLEDDALLKIGNGTSDNDRSNAFSVDWTGQAKAGGETLAKASNLVVEQVSASVSANSGTYYTVTLTGGKPGYYPLCVAGYNFAGTNRVYQRCYMVRITNREGGAVTVQARAFNTSAGSYNGTVYVDVLWVKL